MEIIQQATEITNTLNYCFFGISDLKLCSYDPLNPIVYFSLGEGIAALGLLFAILHLQKPIWKMTLRIRNKFARNLHWYFAIIGLFSLIISVLLTQFFIAHRTILHYPVFWELIAFFAFVSSVFTSFFLSMKRTNLINEKNARRFYKVLLNSAAVTRKNHTEDVINLVGSNLNKIIDLASKTPRRPDRNWDPNEQPESSALGVLEVVLTEPEIVKYITTSRIDFLLHFIQKVKESRIDHTLVRSFFREITQELFSNPSSYFYRQLEYGGLGNEKPIYNALFHDQVILDNFRTLGNWNYWERDTFDKKFLQVYLQALKTAIEGYWFDQNAGISIEPFYSAFTQLTHAAQSFSSNVKNEKDSKFVGTEFFWLLNEIASFYSRTFPIIYNEALEKEKVKDLDLEVKVDKDRHKHGESITAFYVDGLFGFFEALSYIDGFDDDIRSFAIDSTSQIIEVSSGSDQTYQKMRTRFLKLLWDRFEENVKGGYAPMIRVYISLILFPAMTYPTWLEEERKRLITFLYEKIKPIITKDPEKIKRFLPIFVEYNTKTKKFEWVSRGDDRTVLKRPKKTKK